MSSLSLFLVLVLAGPSAPDDAFYVVPVGSLESTEGKRPDPAGGGRAAMLRARISVDGPGEAFIDFRNLTACFQGPRGAEVKGILLYSRPDGRPEDAAGRMAFRVPPSDEKPGAKAAFLRAKEEHYEQLLRSGRPGAAWFRHQADLARSERLAIPGEKAEGPEPMPFWPGRPLRQADLEETYSLFTGGRALAENLQLDRLLAPAAPGEETVDMDRIPGISVREFDWKPVVKDLKPKLDPLASLIPADQHALFFPSFQAMVDTFDEADRNGTPILQLLEPRSEDARTKDRVEEQLCLSVSALSRLLGPAVVESVAFTGSDPFLRMGSDVAVLFEARTPQALTAFFAAKHAAALAAHPGAKAEKGEVAGASYAAVVSPGRKVSSYLSTIGGAVVIANSPVQLRRLAEARSGSAPALAAADEYVFFRGRYARGDAEESALLVVPDAALRRWCGPRWRILDSRRIRAAAALAEIQAAHLEEIVRGTVQPGPVATGLAVPDAGVFTLTADGPASSTYGTLDFLAPIAEITAGRATKAEAEAYERFRDRYQMNWRAYFDPIAVRFSVKPGRLAADLTVMPLIAGTEYRQMIDFTRGAVLPANAGDPHPGTLLHLAIAINGKAEILREAGSFIHPMVPGLDPNPLGWLGGWAAVYADDGPFWADFEKAQEKERFVEAQYARLPIALRIDVKNAMGLAAFLAAIKAHVEASAPGLTTWETLTWKDRPYVKVSAKMGPEAEGRGGPTVYYRAAPGSLVVTLDEGVLKRAIEREAAGGAGSGDPEAPEGAGGLGAWLGNSVGLRIDRKAIDLLGAFGREEYRNALLERSWGNIAVLNEWKRLFPDRDPVEVHEKLWKTRLECPGGGKYVWNEKSRTMESTVFGHSAEPRGDAPRLPPAAAAILRASFGLTFEGAGLRARAEVERKP